MLKNKKLSKAEITWNVIIFTAVTLTALEAPFSFTFETNLQTWQVILDIIISLIFMADVCYQITQKRKGKINFATQQDKYSWWGLIAVDVVASIPFDLISYFLGGMNGVRILSFLRLFRMVRIIRLFQIVGQITIVPRGLRVSIYSVMFILAVHWISCAWVRVETIPGINDTDIYVKALYWTVTTLTTIGYGDITPTTMHGRIFTMLVMILGVGVYGIVIGNVTRMIAAGERYKEQAREKMTDLGTFMKYYNIPERLQQNVFSYYQHLLTKRLTDNDNKIINELPQALQHELQMYMNIKLIRTLPIFRDCTQQCLKDVAAALQQKYFGPGQTVINIGEVGEEMYVIGHGIVEVILKDGSTVATLHEGQFFGEAALLRETKRNANVRAQSYCDLYKLDKEDFSHIVDKHPELLESIERVANKRSSDRRAPKPVTQES